MFFNNWSSQKKAAWLFLAPSLILYTIYVILPITQTFYLSFTEWDGMRSVPLPLCFVDEELSCFENYIEILDDDVFITSFKNNLLWLCFFSLSPFMGLFMALFFHVKGPLASLYKSMIFTPMVFSLVVVGMVWGWFFQPELGLLEFALHKTGLMEADQHVTLMSSFTWATAGVIIAASWPHAAYCMILFLAGMSQIKKNVIEAAEIDGASKIAMLWHIILPSLRGATIVVVIVTMIGALRTFELISVMTAGGPANSSNVLANYMYQQTFQGFRYGYGSAIAVVLFCISLVLILSYLHITQKSQEA